MWESSAELPSRWAGGAAGTPAEWYYTSNERDAKVYVMRLLAGLASLDGNADIGGNSPHRSAAAKMK